MATSAVGEALREERLRQGLALRDISLRTRISVRFLEAIESEKFDQLPGILFTRNFVRQYASCLKLDPGPLLASLPRVDLESAPLPEPSPFAAAASYSPSGRASSTAIWVLMAAGVSFGAWLYFEHPRGVAVTASAPARQVQAPERRPETPPGPPGIPSETPARPLPESPTRAVQVVLKAKEASWVQIVADGKNAFTGILKPNDSREVGADALVKVTAGNAGGIEISLNGKSLDPLGASGQVRTVRLTAEGMQPPSRTPAPNPL